MKLFWRRGEEKVRKGKSEIMEEFSETWLDCKSSTLVKEKHYSGLLVDRNYHSQASLKLLNFTTLQ